MKSALNALLALIYPYKLKEGWIGTNIPGLTIYNSSHSRINLPNPNDMYFYIIVSGAIRIYTPSGIMDYVAGQYSISNIDMPQMGEKLDEKSNLIMLIWKFSREDVFSVIREFNQQSIDKIIEKRLPQKTVSFSSKNIIKLLCRTLELSCEYPQCDFLMKQLKKELIFYLLTGEKGKELIQCATRLDQAKSLYEVNSWIKENFKESFTVNELATQSKMSVSLFHQKFKEAIGMGPLQCQKRLRLTEARRLMIDEKQNVTEAALNVGYGSLSQFTRDYRKIFGFSPTKDTYLLKQKFSNLEDNAKSKEK